MGDEKQRLSYEEFASLLQRSIAVEGRRGARTYSREDLLKAAGELRIDPAVAAELVDAHLERRAAVEAVPRPFDTRIELTTNPESFELTIPPLRLTARSLAHVGFVALWFAFIALWTSSAVRGGWFFAVFSIPFWGAGLAMAWQFVLPLIQTTRLKIDRTGGSLQARPVGRAHSLRTSELKARIGDHVGDRRETFGTDRKAGRALLLEHGTKTIPLLDGYSEQEQRWIESELRAWLLGS